MNFHIMTLFPEMVMGGLNNSIIKRALEKELIGIEAVNIRDYTLDKHGKVDDYPFGGGAGMLMQAQPVYDCYKAILEKTKSDTPRVIYLSPQGKTFTQKMAVELAEEEDLILLCGHYEGIDQRVGYRLGGRGVVHRSEQTRFPEPRSQLGAEVVQVGKRTTVVGVDFRPHLDVADHDENRTIPVRSLYCFV